MKTAPVGAVFFMLISFDRALHKKACHSKGDIPLQDETLSETPMSYLFPTSLLVYSLHSDRSDRPKQSGRPSEHI